MAEQALQPYKNNPYLPNSSWAAPFPPQLNNECLQPHEDDPHLTPSSSSLLPPPLKKCLITHTVPPAHSPAPPPPRKTCLRENAVWGRGNPVCSTDPDTTPPDRPACSAKASSMCGNMKGWLQILRSCMIVFIRVFVPPLPCRHHQQQSCFCPTKITTKNNNVV